MFQTKLLENRTAFTASLPTRNLSSGRFIDELALEIKTENSTFNATTIASLLDLLQPITVRLFGSDIISIRGSDLYALNVLMLGFNPFSVVGSATTDSQNKIMGLRVPLWQSPRPSGQLTYTCTRVAETNADTETLTMCEWSNDKILKPKYLYYVEIPMTLAGATGFGNRKELPRVGDLLGILMFSTTIPSASVETTSSIDQLRVEIDDTRVMDFTWQDLKAGGKFGTIALMSSPADASIIDNYVFVDFRDDPITKDHKITLDINAGTASDAVRIIPVFAV